MNKQQAFNKARDREANRFALIQKLGIEYTAEYVPFSKSRHAGDKNYSLNWKVTIRRGNQSLTTDYMQGIGHLPGYKKYQQRTIFNDEIISRAVETGTLPVENSWAKGRKIDPPELQDVLYSLVMDSEAIDHSTFEEWASAFGYDTDSRKAEKIYRTCLEIGLKLRAILGGGNLDKLGELFQDY